MLSYEDIRKSLIRLNADIEPNKKQPSYASEHYLEEDTYLYVKGNDNNPLVLPPCSIKKKQVIDLIDGLSVMWVPSKNTSFRKFPKFEGNKSQYGYGATVEHEGALELLVKVLIENQVETKYIESESKIEMSTEAPLNQILYGPPGTGKTYSTTLKAVLAADPEWASNHKLNDLEDGKHRDEVKAHYDKLVDEGRITFTTFHQSFSYEDFVEGIRARPSRDGSGVSYSVEDGVFKKIAVKSDTGELGETRVLPNNQSRLWKISLGGANEHDRRERYIEAGEARVGWRRAGDLSLSPLQRSAEERDYWDELEKNDRSTLNAISREISIGDVLLCFKSESSIQAVGVVCSDYIFDDSEADEDYHHIRKVDWLIKDIDIDIRPLNAGKKLTQKTIYPLWRISWQDILRSLEENGLRPSLEGRKVNSHANHVLIIDEINRGNISRIFGELITLLEPDKRKGAADERSVVLPYSKEKFSVPSNLYVIGTMNTADKSLAQLDFALRRRFEFEEVMPKPSLLKGIEVHGVNVNELLDEINQRIEVLLDRDHMIGHAYFWPLKLAATEIERKSVLADIFSKRIIPLLQEYFYSDWERISWVLNDNSKAEQDRFISFKSETKNINDLFDPSIVEQINDRRYMINDGAFLNPESYRKILS